MFSFEELEKMAIRIWNSQSYKTKAMKAVRVAYIQAKRDPKETRISRLEREITNFNTTRSFTKEDMKKLADSLTKK